MKLKLPSIFSKKYQYNPDTQEKINTSRENTQAKRAARVKKNVAKKNIPESDAQSTTRSVKLSARIAIGWSNFRNKCSINWKKLCMNSCFTSESDKHKLQTDINTLEGKIKGRNNAYKAKKDVDNMQTALDNDDPRGLAKATLNAVAHGAKALFNDPAIITNFISKK